VVAAALIASSLYVILDMDEPFSGPVQISPAPLQRAVAEMQR
jgi:ABC-type proline/glycine betaine transport system ATPase subunit